MAPPGSTRFKRRFYAPAGGLSKKPANPPLSFEPSRSLCGNVHIGGCRAADRLQKLPLRRKAKTNDQPRAAVELTARAENLPREQEGGLSLVSSQLLSTPADPGFWLRFRSGPVLTYPRTLRSGPRESLARTQAWRAGSCEIRPMVRSEQGGGEAADHSSHPDDRAEINRKAGSQIWGFARCAPRTRATTGSVPLLESSARFQARRALELVMAHSANLAFHFCTRQESRTSKIFLDEICEEPARQTAPTPNTAVQWRYIRRGLRCERTFIPKGISSLKARHRAPEMVENLGYKVSECTRAPGRVR
jgi:hypothetical protein